MKTFLYILFAYELIMTLCTAYIGATPKIKETYLRKALTKVEFEKKDWKYYTEYGITLACKLVVVLGLLIAAICW